MIAVRPATAADIPAIRAVAAVTWRATYAGLIAAPDIEWFLERAYSEAQIARTLDWLSDGYLVATDEESVVGYAMAGPDREGAAEVWAIYVLPDYQGKGVGHALWERATAHLWAGGYVECTLWVVAGNTAARRFYERHGAVAVGERLDEVGESRVAEIQYRVRLHPPRDRASPH
jgi:ribosomal protein S18 acetylase RimI-like enzyme